MRILMVNKFYPPAIGGVETVVAQYAQAATQMGARVDVLACRPSGLATRREHLEGIAVTRCGSLGTIASMPISPAMLARYLGGYRNYDLIHFHEPFPLGTVAAVLTGNSKKYLITWHSDIIRQRLLKHVAVPLQRIACARAFAITTTSPALASGSEVLKAYQEKVRVIPLSVTQPGPDRHSRATELTGRYFLYLGRLATYKGLRVLVEALPLIDFSDAKLVIAGDGVEKTWLASQLQAYADRVLVISRPVSEAEKQSLLANCEFLVFPSIENNEAFGIVQLEAMAWGKPVVNTRLSTGVPWVSPHLETGITVEPSDAAALAAAITRLLREETLREALGARAKDRIEARFCDSAVLPKIQALYQEAAVAPPRC